MPNQKRWTTITTSCVFQLPLWHGPIPRASTGFAIEMEQSQTSNSFIHSFTSIKWRLDRERQPSSAGSDMLRQEDCLLTDLELELSCMTLGNSLDARCFCLNLLTPSLLLFRLHSLLQNEISPTFLVVFFLYSINPNSSASSLSFFSTTLPTYFRSSYGLFWLCFVVVSLTYRSTTNHPPTTTRQVIYKKKKLDNLETSLYRILWQLSHQTL